MSILGDEAPVLVGKAQELANFSDSGRGRPFLHCGHFVFLGADSTLGNFMAKEANLGLVELALGRLGVELVIP